MTSLADAYIAREASRAAKPQSLAEAYQARQAANTVSPLAAAPSVSPVQRGAFGLMTGEPEQKQYLEQQFGPGNAQLADGRWQVRGAGTQWGDVNPSGLDWGDVTGAVGPAIEYGAGALGTAAGAMGGMPIVGGIAGQTLGRVARQGFADVALGGSDKDWGQRGLDVLESGGEALLGGAAGKVLQGAVNIGRGVSAPVAADIVGGLRRTVNPNGQWVTRQAYDAAGNGGGAFASISSEAAKHLPTNPLATVGNAMINGGQIAMTASAFGAPTLVKGAALVGAGKLANSAGEWLAQRSASELTRIALEPGGLEMLKKLAAPGLNTQAAAQLTQELSGFLADSQNQ
jgi:hypothetical protein